jgi:hypothetical protein
MKRLNMSGYGASSPLHDAPVKVGSPPQAVSHWQSDERLQSTEAVRKRDCRYGSHNNPLAALSIRFEGFNAWPGCDTKLLIVVTVRCFHTAWTHSGPEREESIADRCTRQRASLEPAEKQSRQNGRWFGEMV